MKETRKQIVEQTRNEVAKSYSEKINSLKEQLAKRNKDVDKLRDENFQLKVRNDKLEDEVVMYEDWVRRLQEYMDMPVEKREEAMARMKAESQLNKTVSALISSFGTMFGI